ARSVPNHVGVPTMAAKTKKQTNSIVWVDISLSAAEGKAMREMYATGEKLEGDLMRILDSGYKVTLSHDDYNNADACFLIPKGDDNPNTGMILTARGSDFWKALRGALFRHFVLFEGGKWTNHEKQVIDAD
ncbi:MAG TPA: hypothetical protein VFM05_12890, partial [Candidatus Saccharimonadales bacterium]|nr:hypothetical protein [Candidatus Saccharimonadales bacterium]